MMMTVGGWIHLEAGGLTLVSLIGDMMESVDITNLKFVGQKLWGFKSPCPYYG